MKEIIYVFVKGLIKLLSLPFFVVVSLLLLLFSFILALGDHDQDFKQLDNFIDWFFEV